MDGCRWWMAILLGGWMFTGTTVAEEGALPWPANLLAEGIPGIPTKVRDEVGAYLEFRPASFVGWRPGEATMLVSTRITQTPQLHLVTQPGVKPEPLTNLPEPVSGGAFRPHVGDCLIFLQDTGGGEAYQIFRLDLPSGKITLLTDGKSRHTAVRWSRDGKKIAYASNARNGKDNDIYVMDPFDSSTSERVFELTGGGWGVSDWSPDGQRLLLGEFLSANESHVWLGYLGSKEKVRLTTASEEKATHRRATFSADGKSIYLLSDAGNDFRRLMRLNLAEGKLAPAVPDAPWDVDDFELHPQGDYLAYVRNEAGASRLYIARLKDDVLEVQPPALPMGVIGGLEWDEAGERLGLTITAARSPADAWSLELSTGKLTRWTQAETGGLDVQAFAEPEIISLTSFDGTPVSGILYRPSPTKFPGKRPVLMSIHGGPESQSRPGFLGRTNYYLDKLGVALLLPNVRGSEGYGKRFLQLDNGFLREDSVRDLGAFLDFIQQDPHLDAERVGVTGGSYGGYMTLACMIHFSDRIRAGCDIVGISNFLTFLKNTSDYRRDLRRVEYGDERDPKMREFLEAISPTNHVSKIRKPLFVVQGKNDPRVPVTEAEQMVKLVREQGTPVWYLMAQDEGHGFAKKANVDLQFLATVQFWRQFLLD